MRRFVARATGKRGQWRGLSGAAHDEIDPSSRTINTPAGALPISPLMDQSFLEARRRWKLPKAKSDPHRKTKWQRIMARNPFGRGHSASIASLMRANPPTAQALATPPRQCDVTDVVLPRFFLQGFNLMKHPDSDDPWWVPLDLSPGQSSPTEEETCVPASGEARDDARPADSLAPSQQPVHNPRPKGGTGYILARQELLRALTSKQNKYYSKQKRLLTKSRSTRLSTVLKRAVWREDMSDLVLELRRRRIIEDVLYFSKLCEEADREYLAKCEAWGDFGGLTHRGCVLYLADGDSPITNGTSNETSAQPPARLSLMDIEGAKFGSKLVVHNLDALLGKENVDSLRRRSGVIQTGSLFVLRGKRTLNLQLKLWKLQCYMTRDSDAGQPISS